MENQYLLEPGKSGFFKGKGKYRIAFVLFLVAAVVVAGFLLYPESDQTGTDLELSFDPERSLIPESWVKSNFGTNDIDDVSVGGNFGDPDGDKLNNYQEYLYGTDPNNPDTDGDLYFDGTEVAYGSNPLGAGGARTGADIGQNLRKIGLDVTIGEVEKEFGPYLNLERDPYITDITLDQLNISQDNSQAAAEQYNLSFQEISAYTNSNDVGALSETLFLGISRQEADFFVENQAKVVNDLKALPVPSELAQIHLTYLKLYDGLLGMGKFVQDKLENKESFEEGNFYPELQYMVPLDRDLAQLRIEAFEKYQITI